MRTIEADYLVVGAGAKAMAFIDTLITETAATVVIIDRYGQPGGHWTTAYPFVRLHQPSAYYGVNSRPLGNDTSISTAGTKASTNSRAQARSARTSTPSCASSCCRRAGCPTSR